MTQWNISFIVFQGRKKVLHCNVAYASKETSKDKHKSPKMKVDNLLSMIMQFENGRQLVSVKRQIDTGGTLPQHLPNI